MTEALKKPIIIVGAPRSGTTIVARLFAGHPDVAYWGEPRSVWLHKKMSWRTDFMPVAAADEATCAYIRDRFAGFCRQAGGSRFCEKTPGNTLRLGYVLKVFPNAKILHVLRDGRDVAVSLSKKSSGDMRNMTHGGDGAPLQQSGGLHNLAKVFARVRMRLSEGIPLVDWPYFLPQAIRKTFLFLGFTKTAAWGVDVPGLTRIMKTHSLLEACALQWRMCVEAVTNYVAAHPEVDYHLVRYEDLVTDPANVTREIFDFAELPVPRDLQTQSTEVVKALKHPFETELNAEEQRAIMEHIASTLRYVGYEVPGTPAGAAATSVVETTERQRQAAEPVDSVLDA